MRQKKLTSGNIYLNFYKDKDELPDYLVVLPPTAPEKFLISVHQ